MALAVLAGVANAFGAVLQKRAVDRTSPEVREQGFMAHLLRTPGWLLGLGIMLVLGTIFVLLAQDLIGPALVPGLSAAGLIVLAAASVKLLGEHLKPSEVLGIVAMVFGVLALGLSSLTIPSREVDFLDADLLLRIAAFTAGLALCWLVSLLMARTTQGTARGLSLAVSGGFMYALSNMWILPLIATIGLVFSGAAQTVQVAVFVAACVMLVATNVAGLRQLQEAYKFAPASKVQPLLQVPNQIVPILLYFVVFRRVASGAAPVLVTAGVALILLSGFLLARRSTQLAGAG